MQRATVLLAVAVIALQCCFVPQAEARQLQAAGACAAIPKCNVKCVTHPVDGVPVCPQCVTGYVKWNKGKACVCPRGQYDNAGTCTTCPLHHYCPGVAMTYASAANETATDRGDKFACDTAHTADPANGGLITRKTGIVNWKSCLTKPGYILVNGTDKTTQTAEACTGSTYNVGYQRANTCRACKPGMEITGITVADHDSETDCVVSAGYIWDPLLARAKACPKGAYRVGTAARLSALTCDSCGTGISTNSSASIAATECKVLLPGYKCTTFGTACTAAAACGHGTYFPGGPVTGATNCTDCGGYTTKDTGSTQISDCMAPPGYYLPAGASPTLTACPDSIVAGNGAGQYDIVTAYGTFGTYRPLWATTPNGLKDCKVCGANMLSERKDASEHPTDTTTLVAASSDACYIVEGAALNIDNKLQANISQWRASTCNSTTAFGAKNTTYGLEALVCKPCGRNLLKNTATGTNRDSVDACINDDGFGMSADGTFADRCPIGSWAARGSLLPCTSCGVGRTTKYDATLQKAITDCYVLDGYGVSLLNATTDAEQWYEGALLPANDTDKAVLDVSICPVGRYSDSTESAADVGARCVACASGSTTEDEGSTAQSDCSVCLPGKGDANATDGCDDCARGTFNDGSFTSIIDGTLRTAQTCLSCPNKVFTYSGQDDLTSASTTKAVGSVAVHACVPEKMQISSSAGTTLFSGYSSNLVSNVAPNFTACVDACKANDACHFSEYRYANPTGGYTTGCFLFTSTGSDDIYYKLTPSLVTGALKARSLASGLYAKRAYNSAVVTDLGDTLTDETSAANAATACDGNMACWGFIKASDSSYLTKTGTNYPLLRTVVNSWKSGETTTSTIIVTP